MGVLNSLPCQVLFDVSVAWHSASRLKVLPCVRCEGIFLCAARRTERHIRCKVDLFVCFIGRLMLVTVRCATRCRGGQCTADTGIL